jgi:hypothetical protein
MVEALPDQSKMSITTSNGAISTRNVEIVEINAQNISKLLELLRGRSLTPAIYNLADKTLTKI